MGKVSITNYSLQVSMIVAYCDIPAKSAAFSCESRRHFVRKLRQFIALTINTRCRTYLPIAFRQV
jgi:hypothetical protein